MTAVEETTKELSVSLSPDDAARVANRLHSSIELQLAKAHPTATAEISDADREVEEAQARAEAKRAERQSKVEFLRQQMRALDVSHKTISELKKLLVTDADLARLGPEALGAYVMSIENPSPASISNWECRLADLIRLSVLQPHLPAAITKLELEATQLSALIKSTAANERIDLRNLNG